MQSDNQLVRKIKRKQNREAADILVERYYKEIYGFTYRQTGDLELSMDLTQEIFISILQGIHTFEERKASFRTWAYHVAANKITDYYRSLARKKREMEVPFLLDADEEGSGMGISEERLQNANQVTDVLEGVMKRETIQRVMEVVVQFKSEWIQIFQKKCFEEMTFAEISEELGLSENTIKTRFYSMIRKIKQEVEPDE
ncbi:MAG: RNA polymerase sigma factor [Lachnospiraceae bacterium]|nr:RNA polymerase sigma factor [Lachnospiraceae bacterium]